MTKTFIAAFAFTAPFAFAQRISPGVIGGVPAQPPVQQSTVNIPFVLGPTVAIELWQNLSLQTGVLFNRLGTSRTNYSFAVEGGLLSGSAQWQAHAAEIPILLRYHLLNRSHTWRPFVSAGPSVRRTTVTLHSRTSVSSSTPLPAGFGPMDYSRTQWSVDPVLGAGVSFKSGRVHLEPEVRYSYWDAGKDTVVRKNQVNFLFGLRF